MNQLREAVLQYKSANPAPVSACFVAKASVPGVQIHLLSGESWVLPWGNFESARYLIASGSDHLLLSFARYEALLQGVRLAPLLPDIAAYRLESVYELPVKLLSQADKDRPFISRLTVRSLADLTKSDLESS
jgi:hypothetical protein